MFCGGCFFDAFLVPLLVAKGWPKSFPRGAFWGTFSHFWGTLSGTSFWHRFSSHFRLPEGGKKLCFLFEGCQKSMFGLSRKCAKNHLQNDSILVPFWHQMADFWGIQKSIKKCTPKVWHMVPKGCPNGVTFGAKSRANSRKKAGPYFWPSQAPFWVAFWTCFGTFFDHVLVYLWRFLATLFVYLQLVCS